MLNELNENEILRLSRQGDEAAVTLIISKYKASVEAAVSRISDSPIEREDLIQEGLIGLLAAVRSFDGEKKASFRTYCYTCISNALQSALRKVSRKKDVPKSKVISLENDFETPNEASVNTAISAEDAFLAKESVESLNEFLDNELSAFENEVLKMHIAGCSYKEIADRMGKTPKAVDNAIQRIRKKLKEISL